MTKIVNISLSEEDLMMIDIYCAKHNFTRSKFFTQLAVEKIQMESLISMLGTLKDICRRGYEKGYIDPSHMELVQAIEESLIKEVKKDVLQNC